MTDRTYKDFFEDILEAAQDIEDFTEDMSFSEFKEDKKTIKAVLKSIEDMGEASNNVPEEIRDDYYQVPWKYMIGMRNKLTHEYFSVDLKIVWKTSKENIPKLKRNIKEILQDMG